MGELQEILELVRAGASDDEVGRVLALKHRVNGHALPHQLLLPPPAPPPPAAPPRPVNESVKEAMLDLLPVAVLDAAPSGTVWHISHARIAVANKGGRYRGARRTDVECRAAIFGALACRKQDRLVTTSSQARKGFTIVTKR